MKHYSIEGVILTARGVKRHQKTGKTTPADLEAFSLAVWAESEQRALEEAQLALRGGSWVEGPKISLKSEEQRMREQGAPELPGLSSIAKKKLK